MVEETTTGEVVWLVFWVGLRVYHPQHYCFGFLLARDSSSLPRGLILLLIYHLFFFSFKINFFQISSSISKDLDPFELGSSDTCRSFGLFGSYLQLAVSVLHLYRTLQVSFIFYYKTFEYHIRHTTNFQKM